MNCRVALALGTLFASLWAITPAVGATFDVAVCKAPGGAPAGTDGWTAINATPGMQYDLSCEDGQFGVAAGPLQTELPQGFQTGWKFDLPKPLTIKSFKVEKFSSVTMWSGWSGQIWGHLHDQPEWLGLTSCDGDNCAMPLTEFPAHDIGSIGFGIRCSYKPCSAGSYAAMHVSQLLLTIDDPASPQIESADGSLLAPGPITRLATLGFRASDPESGVRLAQLEVDGQVVASQSFNTPLETCQEPFKRVDPCPHSVDAALGFDTSHLLDGPHSARLLVFDASGDHPAIAGPWQIATDNSRVANLCQAPLGSGARVRLLRSTVNFGRGTSMVLTWPGMPWATGRAVVFAGRDHLAQTAVAARKRGGRYVADIPSGHNRLVRIGIHDANAIGPYFCSRPLWLKVRAGATIHAAPRHLSNGERVRVTGRLRGTARSARTVVLQARARGGRRNWVPVAVTRSRKRGRFQFTYRFERTLQRTDYLFRVRVPAQRGFPYTSGHTRSRSVYVDP
jgi:hypothetical protein